MISGKLEKHNKTVVYVMVESKIPQAIYDDLKKIVKSNSIFHLKSFIFRILRLIKMMTDMEDFFVVHTKPNQENKAKKNLEFQGFKTWLPIYKKAVVRKNRLFLREEPFFLDTFLFFFDISKDNWSRIFSTLGVKYLITFDGKPKAVEKKLWLV